MEQISQVYYPEIRSFLRNILINYREKTSFYLCRTTGTTLHSIVVTYHLPGTKYF